MHGAGWLHLLETIPNLSKYSRETLLTAPRVKHGGSPCQPFPRCSTHRHGMSPLVMSSGSNATDAGKSRIWGGLVMGICDDYHSGGQGICRRGGACVRNRWPRKLRKGKLERKRTPNWPGQRRRLRLWFHTRRRRPVLLSDVSPGKASQDTAKVAKEKAEFTGNGAPVLKADTRVQDGQQTTSTPSFLTPRFQTRPDRETLDKKNPGSEMKDRHRSN